MAPDLNLYNIRGGGGGGLGVGGHPGFLVLSIAVLAACAAGVQAAEATTPTVTTFTDPVSTDVYSASMDMNNDGTWAATMTINFNTPVKFHTSEADTLQDIVVYRRSDTTNTKGAASATGSGIEISGSTVKVHFLPPAEDALRLMGVTGTHLYISGTAIKSVDTSTDLAQVGSMSPSGSATIEVSQSDANPPQVASARLDRDSGALYIIADESLGYGTYKTSSDDVTFPTTLNTAGQTVNSNATKFHLRDGATASSGGITMSAASNNPSTHGSPRHEIRFTLTPTQLSTVTGYANPHLYVDVKAFSGIEDGLQPLTKKDNVAHNKQLNYLPRLTSANLSETTRVLTLTFDESVTKGSGTFYIRNSATGSYTASTDVSGTLSSVSGTAGSATLSASDLTKVQNMATPHLHLNAGAVTDSGGAPNAKKAVALTTVPALSGTTIDRATGAATLTFDKSVTKSTGNIDIRDGSGAAHDAATDVRIPASDASVSASGSSVTFTLSSADLAKVNAMASPHLYLAASAVVDSSSTPNDALSSGQDIVLSPRLASASLVPATRALSATFGESVSAPATSPGNVYVASAGDADGFTSGTDVRLPLSGTAASHSATITAAELARVLAMTDPKLYAEANAATVSGLANAAGSVDLALTAPAVSSAAVDIGTGAVTLTFSYGVSAGAGSMDITQTSSAAYDPSAHVRVAVSDTTVSGSQLAFTLSEPDRKKVIALGATLWARLPAGLVSGGAGGDLSAVSYRFTVTADTTAPTLVATGPTRPALDEETGILTLTFSESVKDGSDVDLEKIFIGDGAFSTGGTALSVSGAASTVTSTADTDARITVKLTEELRKAAIGYGTPHVRLDAGAVKDLSNQNIAAAASTEINDLADATAPTLVTTGSDRPALDEETGILTLTFSESVKDGADVDLTKIFVANDPFSAGGTALTGSAVTSTEDTDARITIELTEELRRDSIGYAVPHVRLDSGAVKDLSNQDIAAAASAEINDLADTAAPTLVASGANGPALDEETGILTLSFDESVKDSGVDLAKIFINDGAFTSGGAALTGSAVTSTAETDAQISIDLTEALRKSAIGYTTPHVRLDSGAVKDLSNQDIAAAASAEITDTADTAAPQLSSDTAPVFHTPTGALTIVFDESVKDGQANVDLAKIFISSDTSVSGGTALTGSTVSSTDDTDAEISITVPEALRLQVVAPTYAPYLRFDAGAVSDLSSQAIAASTVGTAIRKVTDTDPPQVSSAALNEETGSLIITFDETVDVSSAADEGASFALREGPGASAGSAGEVVLSDAEIKPGQTDGPALEFQLSEASRRDAIALADPHLYIAAGAIEDIALNGIGEPASGPSFATVVDVSQTLDTNAPALRTTGNDRPALDEGTGVLTLTFDESVRDGAGVDLTKIFIRDGPGAGGAALTGSAVTSSADTDAEITVELTEALRQSAIGYGTPHVRLEPGAVRDLSDRGSAAAGAEIDDSSDLAPPRMTMALVDATRRVLVLVFDEYVQAGPSGSASLVSGGAQTRLADATPQSLEDRTRVSYDLSLAELGIAVGAGARASIGAGSGVSDTSGNPARAASADLVVTDETAPAFVSATIISDSVVRAVFDDILAAPSASDFAVSGHRIASVSLGPDGSTVNITIAGAFAEGRSVQVAAGAGIRDMFGNPLAPTTLTAEYEPIRVAVRALTISSDNAARNPSNADGAERGLVRAGDTVTLRLEADPSGARIAQAYLQISSASAAASVDGGGLGLSASLRVPPDAAQGPLQFAINTTDEFGLRASLGPGDLTGANVSADTVPPAVVSASASGIDSVTVRYSERVAVGNSGATVTVGSATYSASFLGSGSETILAYWDGVGSVPQSAVLRGLVAHDMAGNAGSDGPVGAGPSVGSASPGPTGVMPIAKGTTLRTVTAPAGVEPALELSSASATDPRVAFAGGRTAAFENPLSIITQEPGLPDLFFQAGTEVGGLAGFTVAEVGLEAAVVVAPSEYEVPAGSPALDAYPGLYNPATAVLVGSPVSDIAFSKPVRMEFDIPLSGLVFSVDASGTVLPIPACAEGYEGAVPLLQEAPEGWPAETYDPLACVSEDSVWTLHFSVFGVAYPSSGGSECDDCTPPTLGYDEYGAKLVDGGFAYNGLASDVAYFFTPYPLIESEVGKQNTVALKMYENEGPGNVEHVSLAFGLRSGEVISESRAVINYDIAFDGTGTVSVIDPDGAIDLETLSASHEVVECSAGSTLECLSVTITHMFRAPLEFDIVGTDVWDRERNSWQNYYNHGIHVSGEPLDPQPGIEVDGLVLYPVSSGTDVMMDAGGHLFKMSPEGVYVPLSNQSRLYHDIDESMYLYDGVPMQGYDRSDPQFRDHLYAQVLAAQQVLDSMMPPAKAGEPVAEPAAPDRAAAEQRLREAVLAERARAALLFEELFGHQRINGQD